MVTGFAVSGALLAAALVAWWLLARARRQAKAELTAQEARLRGEFERAAGERERAAELELERRRTDLECEFDRRRAELRAKEDEAVNALLSVEKERDLIEKRREALELQIQEAESREDLARKRLMDGQYDQCDLTFRELGLIEESTIKSLCAIYHGRISYPSTVRTTGEREVAKQATA